MSNNGNDNILLSSNTSLIGGGMSKLSDEPTRIRNELESIQVSIDRISTENFSIHVDAHEAIASISQESFPKIEKSFNSLSSSVLPGLFNAVESFKSDADKIYAAHKRNQQAIALHTQLLDLLVLPHLLDTCIRRGLFDDALDLSSFALTLQRRHTAISQGLIAIEHPSKPSINNMNQSKEEISNKGNKKQYDQLSSSLSLEPVPGSGVEIIHSIVREVEASTALMRQQLLQQLRTQINLPTCLRVIGYLKRLDAQERFKYDAEESNGDNSSSVLSDPIKSSDDTQFISTPTYATLRHEFLDCRDAYIRTLALQDALVTNNVASGLISDGFSEKDRPYHSIIKIIERNRVTLFDVITQYKSIFFTAASSNSAFSNSFDDPDVQGIVEDGGILARWTNTKINEFLGQLDAHLIRIRDCGSISDVLTRSMYFGTSLAKVGADFRPLLTPIFVKRLCSIMRDYYWIPAFKAAKKDLESGNWGESLPLATASTIVANSSINSNSNNNSKAQQDGELDVLTKASKKIVDQFKPPIELLEFPVLAELTNTLLRSFNELRQCAIFSAVPELIDELDLLFKDNILKGIGEYKIRNIGAVEPKMSAQLQSTKEQQQYITLCKRVAEDLCPYISKCFDAIFGLASGKGKKGLNLDPVAKDALKLMPSIPLPKYTIPDLSNIHIPKATEDKNNQQQQPQNESAKPSTHEEVNAKTDGVEEGNHHGDALHNHQQEQMQHPATNSTEANAIGDEKID